MVPCLTWYAIYKRTELPTLAVIMHIAARVRALLDDNPQHRALDQDDEERKAQPPHRLASADPLLSCFQGQDHMDPVGPLRGDDAAGQVAGEMAAVGIDGATCAQIRRLPLRALLESLELREEARDLCEQGFEGEGRAGWARNQAGRSPALIFDLQQLHDRGGSHR